MKRFLTRAEAANYLRDRYGVRAKTATLAKYASLGGGPVFRRAGRFPVYDVADLDAWAQCRLSDPVLSTAEADVRKDRLGRSQEKQTSPAVRRQQRSGDEPSA